MKTKTSTLAFLKDVLICSLGAYGGPEAHMGIFMDQMVAKKRYVSEEELVELIALCSILPGPTSTQTLVAIGHKTGGPFLAFLTMLVWAAPVLIVMTALSFLYALLSAFELKPDLLRFIGPMAVGFIGLAAYKIGKKVVNDSLSAGLMVFGAVATYFIHSPWIFPLVLLVGGTVTVFCSGESRLWNKTRISPPWPYLFAFLGFALGGLVLSLAINSRIIELFENFFRYGYLVFGGGQVVVPVMHSELVSLKDYMSHGEFLTGYGLVQGLPGPMFSFAAYAGGLAARGGSAIYQIAGAVSGGIGIFLPGLLLIYFVYPIWEDLKKIRAVKVSLKGINAVAGGMIVAAALILMQAAGFSFPKLLVTILTILVLASKKIPAPILVAAVLIFGWIM